MQVNVAGRGNCGGDVASSAVASIAIGAPGATCGSPSARASQKSAASASRVTRRIRGARRSSAWGVLADRRQGPLMFYERVAYCSARHLLYTVFIFSASLCLPSPLALRTSLPREQTGASLHGTSSKDRTPTYSRFALLLPQRARSTKQNGNGYH